MPNLDLDQLSNDLFSLIINLNRKLLDPHETVKNLDLPPSHIKVIFYIFHRGCCPISQIAHELSISKPNMTPILDKLIFEGYIKRSNDPKDRRIILIELTPEGHNFFMSIKKLMQLNLENKIAVLSDNDLLDLNETTKKLSDILNKINLREVIK